MADETLDCKGMNCPMPIVKIAKAMKGLDEEETLEVQADDPAFEADVRAWVNRMGHELVSFDDSAVKTVVIKKAA